MKAFVAILGLVASLTTAAIVPAAAATREHNAGPGYYEGAYENQVDTNDRASSPYAGGVG